MCVPTRQTKKKERENGPAELKQAVNSNLPNKTSAS
jgi:hypothetical protein